MSIEKICLNCGKTFQTIPSHEKDHKFCSKLCQRTFHTFKVPCDNCGKVLTKPKTHIKKHNFCNKYCFLKWYAKHKETEEWKRKQSEARRLWYVRNRGSKKYEDYIRKQSIRSKQTWQKIRENPEKLEARNEKTRAIKSNEIPNILEELTNGKSKKKLSKELGITRATLIRNLRIRGIQRNAKPPRYDPNLNPTYELGYVLGVVYGDGYYTYRKDTKAYMIGLNATDKEFVEYFTLQLCKVLERKTHILISKLQPKAPNRKLQHTTIIGSKKLVLFIKSLNIRQLEERIEATEECKIGFIRGFFDSEGSIHLTSCEHSGRKTPKWLKISISNTNKELLEMIQHFFTSLSIKTFRINEMNMENRWNKKPLYRLSFSSSKENLTLFINRIGTRINRKKENVRYWKMEMLPLLPLIEQERRRKISMTCMSTKKIKH